ncbi:MAG: hypothetical protein Ct9H300mP14_17000 [Gammaproteobacteria bacterium]|nr:MAG: hypothetical protein Ct9H300mP14_17000 [Gammaproteobacteria bacterium]
MIRMGKNTSITCVPGADDSGSRRANGGGCCTGGAGQGLSFGAPTTMETKLAELICSAVASVEQVRMVNSGTEATMSAIRLARGFTGRDKIIKFEGCYHGHADGLLVKAGSGALTLGVPTSPGCLQRWLSIR